jgi:hypothetical protein
MTVDVGDRVLAEVPDIPALVLGVISLAVSAEIVFRPLSDAGPTLLDAMERWTGKLPYVVKTDGSRRYSLPEDRGTDVFDEALDKIDPDWRDHLRQTA